MNLNQSQALENEEFGEEEQQEDVDYNALYGGLDIDTSPPPMTDEQENNYLKIFGDVAKQFTKETLIGLGGTYGDLAELAGVNPQQSPLAKQRNNQEFQALERMEHPDYKPKLSDIELSSNSSIEPSLLGLPTSENLNELNDVIGGPGEPETTAGKGAARAGKLYGGGLAFGQANPLAPIAAGAAGQAVEEAGGDPLLQTAAEIVTLLLTQGKSGSLVSSAKKQVKDKINSLRKLGYTEEDITLAINSANKGGKRAKIASKGKKTEEAFQQFAENSDKIVGDILSTKIPGYESGAKHVHQMASDAYGQVAKQATGLLIKDATPFINSATEVVRDLKKTLGNNPEAQPFLKRLFEAVIDSTKNPTAEKYMNFYKELNAMGKWMDRSQKNRLITKVKEGIKDTFKSEGPQGKKLAQDFEKVNKGIRKAYQAEDISELLQKVTTQDGIDYKKFNKLFDKQDNVQLFQEVLGNTQTNNLKLISKTGKEIKDFDKSWKGANSFRVSLGTDVIRGAAGSYYLYQGDWEKLALVAGTKVGAAGARKLAEKSLTDPKFQNLMIKGLHAIKNASPASMKSVDNAMKKYLEEEGIEIDLD